MRLREVRIWNFRGYATPTTILLDNLTAFVGRNDAGKSSILDALDAVLGEGKLSEADVCVRASAEDDLEVECAFDELPEEVILDSQSPTTLQAEHLLDRDGRLRLRWSWALVRVDGEFKTPGKPKRAVIALHPTGGDAEGLLLKKNADLKKIIARRNLGDACDLTNNASMRRAIWGSVDATDGIQRAETAIELEKIEGRDLTTRLESLLPLYVVFRADRPSTDEDAEVQNPLRMAVQQALREAETELRAVEDKVQARALAVADATLQKLREFDPALAARLEPEFRADPKWESIFKLSLRGEDGVAFNRRGSGVRRLVLMSFFRAQAERASAGDRGVVYAIEEPETGQHPNFQRSMVETLRTLAGRPGSQVLLTTHIPALAELMPVACIRLVERAHDAASVSMGDEETLRKIAETLGVHGTRSHDIKLLLCVEGPNDLRFLRHIGRLLRADVDPTLPCLSTDPRIAPMLLGGSTLREWVNQNLLKGLNIPEWHLYDYDDPSDGSGSYQGEVDTVNRRGGGHSARLTTKRTMENYLHPDAIDEALSIPYGRPVRPEFGDEDHVPHVVGDLITPPDQKRRSKLGRRDIKSWLNDEAAARMTVARLRERDPQDEVLGWFRDIAARLEGTLPPPS